MATLVTLKGSQPGRQFFLQPTVTVLGRQDDCTIYLESAAVSRRHAQIVCDAGRFFLEDLHSSNGTFVNSKRVRERTVLVPGDVVQLGPYQFSFRLAPTATPQDDELVIRSQVNADPAHHTLHGQDARHKLKVVLEIAQHLARTLDPPALLGKLLDHLLAIFPQADRGIALLLDGEELVVRAQRSRWPDHLTNFSYSRTVIRRALAEGIGILSADARADERFQASQTVAALNLRSLVCVPLISRDERRLGALQLDCFQAGKSFRVEDLELVTAMGLQAAVALDNATLHADLLREERLRQELALAREIQEGFLPRNFPPPAELGAELFARVHAANEVAGDLYDFLLLPDRRLAFFVGDVSGKGVPAALVMVAVRTLSRHLAATSASPAETLARLHAALAPDNTSGTFVTLLHGIYDPKSGKVILSSGGHPPPLLRHADGRVEEVALRPGRLLGFGEIDLRLSDYRLTLAPGETLALYTDGFTEARAPDGQEMFGRKRMEEALGGQGSSSSLESLADRINAVVQEFSGSADLQDDQTLLLLRRVAS